MPPQIGGIYFLSRLSSVSRRGLCAKNQDCKSCLSQLRDALRNHPEER